MYYGVKAISSKKGVGKVRQLNARNETRSPTYTTHKNKLKIDNM